MYDEDNNKELEPRPTDQTKQTHTNETNEKNQSTNQNKTS